MSICLCKFASSFILNMNNLDEINSLIKTLSEAIQSDPDNWEKCRDLASAYHNRSIVSHSAKDCSLSIENFTKAIELNPSNGMLHIGRGIAYYNRGMFSHCKEDLSLAIEDFTKVLGMIPNPGEIHYFRGLAYSSRSEFTHSKEDYSLAIEDFIIEFCEYPENWEKAYSALAQLHSDRSRFTANAEDCSVAIGCFTEVIEKNPDNWKSYVGRGIAYSNRGVILHSKEDYSLAIKDFTKAIEKNPDDWKIYYYRGCAYRSISRHTECIEDINASLYWASKHKDIEPALNTVEQVYSTEPFNHWSWLICLVETNKFSIGLMAKYIDLQAQLYDFLLVFKYLEYSQIELSSPRPNFLRIIPILIYHLKGCVTTYRLFDERLDDEDTYQLTAQEYYYYIRSAFHFCMKCKQENRRCHQQII